MAIGATHAQLAKFVVADAAPGVFARACLEVVTKTDYTLLERILPGVKFSSRKLGPDSWELAGVCADGSTVLWVLGD